MVACARAGSADQASDDLPEQLEAAPGAAASATTAAWKRRWQLGDPHRIRRWPISAS